MLCIGIFDDLTILVSLLSLFFEVFLGVDLNSDFGYLNKTSYFFQRGTNISKVQMISCHQQKREAMAVFYVILTYFKTMKYRLRNQSSDTQQEKNAVHHSGVTKYE